MPQLFRADLDRLRQLLAAGLVEAALALLNRLDPPRAPKPAKEPPPKPDFEPYQTEHCELLLRPQNKTYPWSVVSREDGSNLANHLSRDAAIEWMHFDERRRVTPSKDQWNLMVERHELKRRRAQERRNARKRSAKA